MKKACATQHTLYRKHTQTLSHFTQPHKQRITPSNAPSL
jgi:hypothetical protein